RHGRIMHQYFLIRQGGGRGAGSRCTRRPYSRRPSIGVRPISELRYPESAVFYRKLTREYARVVRGEGCWLVDDAGKRYLDAWRGASAASIGHGVAEVARAIGEQAARVAYVNGTAFTAEPVEAMAQELATLAPGDLDKVYFLGSGSEAIEAALKLARQYWVESGKPAKRKVLALTPGYHGNTMLALSASAREHYRRFF